ncbi:MAG: aspartate-semialdehyde dehydrogenase [Lachnospiraceae bacterium]|nr:aspartate-semialdehyde dehydrogenase [Lachnospiraceae bacterium]
MKDVRVGVLGATGAVGREMMNILEERNFPVSELRPLASAHSAGREMKFRGESVFVRQATPESFRGLDIVLGAAEADIARQFAPDILAAGAVFVDNSSAFRLQPEVPLVVPEINAGDVAWHSGIISNPNCSTIITLVAVKGINRLSTIKNMVASTYQAVSGAGAGGIAELAQQMQALSAGEPLVSKIFPYQIAQNLIPRIGGFTANGYTAEEMKLLNEGRKIMHLPGMRVTCTCVRVPVVRSHSISVSVYTERDLSVEEVRAQLALEDGVVLVDDPAAERYPMPLETSGQDKVFVGRIRKDMAFDNGIALWCCGDQVRKGAATNTVQIAELLLK